MKKFIITKCMHYIKQNTKYNEMQFKEIEYGIVSIYLTLSKTIIILLIAFILGILKEVFIFMIFFNILRTFAFGLHANKGWICLLFSTLMFILVPIICKYTNFNLYFKIIICIIGILLIYKNAPADTKSKPIVNIKRRLVLKLISTLCAIIFSIIAIVISNQLISNCLVFALICENILISPLTYKIFKLPYDNYLTFLKEHPDFAK